MTETVVLNQAPVFKEKIFQIIINQYNTQFWTCRFICLCKKGVLSQLSNLPLEEQKILGDLINLLQNEKLKILGERKENTECHIPWEILACVPSAPC